MKSSAVFLRLPREAVRETIRRARANGASEADQVLFGRLAAKSGLKLVLTGRFPAVRTVGVRWALTNPLKKNIIYLTSRRVGN